MVHSTNTGIREFFGTFTPMKEKSGMTLLAPDQEPQGIYYLISGYVKQYALSRTGDAVSIHLFRPESFFPLPWVFSDELPIYAHESVTPVQFYRAPKQEVKAFVLGHPDIAIDIAKRFMQSTMGLARRIEILLTEDARARTIGFLRYMAETIGEERNDNIVLPFAIPHRDIASWIGTTRETASICMSQLMREGSVRMEKRRLIISPKLWQSG